MSKFVDNEESVEEYRGGFQTSKSYSVEDEA